MAEMKLPKLPPQFATAMPAVADKAIAIEKTKRRIENLVAAISPDPSSVRAFDNQVTTNRLNTEFGRKKTGETPPNCLKGQAVVKESYASVNFWLGIKAH
jgi:hypothetical protein